MNRNSRLFILDDESQSSKDKLGMPNDLVVTLRCEKLGISKLYMSKNFTK